MKQIKKKYEKPSTEVYQVKIKSQSSYNFKKQKQ